MFHVDVQFEDMRLIAHSVDGSVYDTTITDGLTGADRNLNLTALQLSYILQFNLHNNGEPEGFKKMYVELEPLFIGWPNSVRPIP